MVIVRALFLAFIIYHHSDTQEGSAPSQTERPLPVVSSSQRTEATEAVPISGHLQDPLLPSLARSRTTSEDPARDGQLRSLPLEMCVRETKSKDHGLLPVLYQTMDIRHAPRLRARGDALCSMGRWSRSMARGPLDWLWSFATSADQQSETEAAQKEQTQEESATRRPRRWQRSVSRSWTGALWAAAFAAPAAFAGCAEVATSSSSCNDSRIVDFSYDCGSSATQGVLCAFAQIRGRAPSRSAVLCPEFEVKREQTICQDVALGCHSDGKGTGRTAICYSGTVPDACYVEDVFGRQPHSIPGLRQGLCPAGREPGGQNPNSQVILRAGQGIVEHREGKSQLVGECSSGSLRRRCGDQGRRVGGPRQDRGRAQPSCIQFAGAPNPSRDPREGRAEAQKAQACRRAQQAGRWIYAIFWLGRCAVTDRYPHLRPLWDVQGCFPETLQWNLSIVDEHNFLPTWAAREKAVDLAFSLGNFEVSRPAVQEQRCPLKRQRFSVKFHDEVRVFLGDADTMSMRHFCSSTTALKKWANKPWALRPSSRSWSFLQSIPMQVLMHAPYDDLPITKMKIIDNHGRPEGFSADGSDHGFPLQEGPDIPLPRVPDFTDNIINALGMLAIPTMQFPAHAIELRTWFVNHEEPRLQWPARYVSLEGDQSTWIAQIRQQWEDALDSDAPTAYQICSPQPPRGSNDWRIALDIIVSQGLHIWRHSGLVTVSFLDDLEGRNGFTVAASLPRDVSGYMIVDAADIHHYCSPIASRRCSIFHGWVPIPVTTDRVHVMRSGHTFIVFIPADPQSDPDHLIDAHDEDEALRATFPEAPQPGGEEQPDDPDQPVDTSSYSSVDEGDYEPGTPVPAPESDPADDMNLFNCHMYRLYHPPMHLFLHHVSGVPLLCEVARILRVQRESFITSHTIQARMVGQHDDDWSFIIQHLDDIPAASTDCLVIVDVEVHFPLEVGAVPALPATTRRVLRVPPFLTRPAVLRYAGVYQYCVLQHDRCLVYIDNIGWPILQPGPRQVRHGTYLRVIVPPALDGNPNTLRAIRDVEEYVQRIMQLPTPSPSPETGVPEPVPAPAPAPAPSEVDRTFLHRFWLQEMQEAFDAHAHVENADEGRVVYIAVWFIDNLHSRTCRTPLMAKLFHDPSEWIDDVLRLWADQLEPDAPARLHLVQPYPPQSSFRSFTLHVLIEQHPIETRAANIVSVHVQERMETKLWQAAFSLPRWVSTEDLIDATQLNFLCETRRCHAVCGPMHFQRFIREEIGAGMSIEIFSRPVRECDQDTSASSSTQAHVPRLVRDTSGASLMQTGIATSKALELTEMCEGQESHTGGAQSDPGIPHEPVGTHPDATLLWPYHDQQFPQIRTLTDLWQWIFQSHVGDVEQVVATTWYIDHLRRPWSSSGRQVALGSNFGVWSTQCRALWRDWILFDTEVEYFVCVDASSGQWPAQSIHILMSQQPQPMRRSALISIHDGIGGEQQSRMIALSMSCTVDHWQLLESSQVLWQCPPQQRKARCSSFCEGHDLSHGHPVEVRDGSLFHIHIDTVTQQWERSLEYWCEQQHDEAAFLQLQTMKITQTMAAVAPTEDFHSDLQNWFDEAAYQNSIGMRLRQLHEQTEAAVSRAVTVVSPQGCSGERLMKQASADTEAVDAFQRVSISLEATLPITAPPVRDDQLFMHSSTTDWQHRLMKSDIQLTTLPEGLHLHPATFDALCGPHGYREKGFADHAVLFIDGAAYDGSAAWSVVCVRFDSLGTPALHGMVAGVVEICPEQPSWMGADKADNISAEFTAFLHAAVLGTIVEFDSKVIIAPDLQLSAKLADDQCTCTAHPKLVQLMICLGAHFHAQGGCVREVRAHRAHPWNELADQLVKHVLFTQQPVGQLHVPVLHDMTHFDDVSWAWITQQAPTFHACLPPSPEPGIWQVSPSCTKPQTKRAAKQPGEHPAEISFDLVTANVLALDACDEQQQILKSTRAARLDLQWHQQHIAAVGLQESRRPPGRSSLDHYVTFSSGALNTGMCPHHGCELWLHRTIPWIVNDARDTLALGQMTPAVAHADPRRLVVNLQKDHIAVSFVVLHAPCRSASPDGSLEAIQEWWKQTISIIRKAKLAPLAWIMADLNADIGTCTTEHFDTHGHKADSEQALIVEDAVQQLDWFAPTTFAWCHSGSHDTWRHPRGTQHRIDFVLCSRSAFDLAKASIVLQDHDTGFSHEDHAPVRLQCAGWLADAQVRSSRRWNFEAMADPDRCREFQEALATLPLPTWTTDVDTHVETWEHNVWQLAQQFFGSSSSTKHRPRLSEITRNLIAFKRTVLDYGRCQDLLQQPDFRAQLKAIEKEIHQRVQQDQQEFYDGLIQQLAQQGELHNYKFVYNLLVRLGGRPGHKLAGGKTLPILKPPGQEPLQTYVDQQMHWLRQFAKVEAGHIMSRDALQHLHHGGLGLDVDILDKAVIPTLYDLQKQIKKMKRGRAPGPNALPTDVLKAGGATLARQISTVTTKIALRGSEPLNWRGGKLIPLHKGKLCRSNPEGYRSIFLSNHTTKVYHGCLRKHLLDAWNGVLSNLQFGGRAGMATDLAHQCLQAHLAHAVQVASPAAILFIDMKAAFYSVVRQGLFEDGPDAAPFLYAMFRMGIAPEHVQKLIETSRHDSAVAGISPHALAPLRDIMERTFFQVDGVDPIALTTQGTRPGDSVGDAFFNVAMAVIMDKVTDKIGQSSAAKWEGQAATVASFDTFEEPASFAWFEVAFVDDCAIAMRAPTNEQLHDLSVVALQAVVDEASIRGLSLNFEVGKTELLVHWRGVGSRAFRETVAAAGDVIQVPGADDPIPLRCTFGYKHLGTWIQNNAAHTRDARARLTEARKAWGPLVRPLFRRPQVRLHNKRQIFESLVCSRLMYNVHVWTKLKEEDVMRWANGLRPLLYPLVRQALRGQPPFAFSLETLCGLAGLITPLDALHLARLRYFQRWINKAPPVLWNLLAAVGEQDGSWLKALKDSMEWFRKFYGERCGLHADSSLQDWITYVSIDECWKGRLKRAVRSCRRYREQYAYVDVWQAAFVAKLSLDGVHVPFTSVPEMDEWQCELCQAVFHSKRALAMHASKAHGYKTLVKHYAFDSQCANCCRDFHGRARLCAHLRAAPHCLQRLRACFPPMDDEDMARLAAHDEVAAKELKKQGWLPTKALKPVVRAFGPPLPDDGHPAAGEMLSKWRARTSAGDAAAVEALAGICRYRAPAPQCQQANEVEMAFLYQSPAGDEDGSAGCFGTGGLAKLHAMLHIRTLCFIHVFSGYRRPQDLQWQIEAHVIQGALQIFTISVDYCLQEEQGDLAGAHRVQWWERQILSGAVFGLGGGPPCETWSAARLQPDGPRPLRTFDEPYGRPALSDREWRQVETGTKLVLFVVQMLHLCAKMGGCGFAEHPAFPLWAKAHRPCSIWALAPMRMLRRLRSIEIFTFDQCTVGCEARKPTTMALLRMGGFARAIRALGCAGRCGHAAGFHPRLQGRDEQGNFRTAVAKVYPPLLNAYLAQAIVAHAVAIADALPAVEPLSPELQELNRLHFVTDQVQPDFYDR